MSTPNKAQSAQSKLERTQARLKLPSGMHALLCAPNRFLDCRVVYDVIDDAKGIDALVPFKVTVNGESGKPSIQGFKKGHPGPLRSPWVRGCQRIDISVRDSTGRTLLLKVMGNIWPWREVRAGEEVLVLGKLGEWRGVEEINRVQRMPEHMQGRIVPIYKGIPGNVSGESVQQLINWAIATDQEAAIEAAIDEVLQVCQMSEFDILDICDTPNENNFTLRDCFGREIGLRDLLIALHEPSTMEMGLRALEVVSRVCALGVQVQAQRVNARAPHKDAKLAEEPQILQLVDDALRTIALKAGFEPSTNQRSVAEEIAVSMTGSKPLNGLLSGEVGAGKTIAYIAPAIAAHRCGAKVAVLAPTMLLADQIANEFIEYFGDEIPIERIEEGGVINCHQSILVGTHSLATIAKKSKYTPNLLICDEQHKLHTELRNAIVKPWTHTVDVSATPVPRSLALSLYEGMTLFTLNEQPVKKHIDTFLIDTKERPHAVTAIKRTLEKGKRVAIILPRVQVSDSEGPEEEEQDTGGLRDESETEVTRASLFRTVEAFEPHFPGKVSILYGKMSDKEKRRELDEFRHNLKPIIVSTTVMETGISVPDVALMIIRDPECFGASGLHQLRGRLARRGGNGMCLLMTEDLQKLSASSLQRLSQFAGTNDGYELAVLDMLSRGAGQINGDQQSGNLETIFKLVNYTTADILMNAENRAEIEIVVNEDDLGEAESTPPSMQPALF